MTPAAESVATVRLMYGQFYLVAGPDVDTSLIAEGTNGLLSLLGPAGLGVLTSGDMGTVQLETVACDGPEPLDDAWEVVAEGDVLLGDAGIGVTEQSWTSHVTALSGLLPGWHRVRCCARDRRHEDVYALGPRKERYRVAAWPTAGPSGLTLLRADGWGGGPPGPLRPDPDWVSRCLERLSRTTPDGTDLVELRRSAAVDLSADVVRAQLPTGGWRDLSNPPGLGVAEAVAAGVERVLAGLPSPEVVAEPGGGCRVTLSGSGIPAVEAYWLGDVWQWLLNRVELSLASPPAAPATVPPYLVEKAWGMPLMGRPAPTGSGPAPFPQQTHERAPSDLDEGDGR